MSVDKTIFAVVGPNGSGKSSAIYFTTIDRQFPFVNPDDIARSDFSSVPDVEKRNLLAWERCNSLRDALIDKGVTFGFETVGSHQSKVDLLRHANELGYYVIVLFVATEDPEINIRRIAHRVSQGGHGVPDDKVRSRYIRTLKLLPEYFAVADIATIWDNSLDGDKNTIRELVRKDIDGTVTILPIAQDVQWIQDYLPQVFENDHDEVLP